jgi:hypothetical protein
VIGNNDVPCDEATPQLSITFFNQRKQFNEGIQMTKRIVLMFMILGVGTVAFAATTTMTFEEFKGFDGALINNFYSGVSFTGSSSGQSWMAMDGSTGFYGLSSYPSGNILSSIPGFGDFWIYDNVAAWTGSLGNNGKIAFDAQDATFVEIGYCSANPFYLLAYDKNGVLLDSDTGPANLRFTDQNPNGPGTLRVDGTGIAYVIMHDQGDFWVTDNIKTDASGIIITPPVAVPAPAAILLAGMGTGLVSWLRNRRTL